MHRLFSSRSLKTIPFVKNISIRGKSTQVIVEDFSEMLR